MRRLLRAVETGTYDLGTREEMTRDVKGFKVLKVCLEVVPLLLE